MANIKVEYVKKSRQLRPHTCHWPSCAEQVPPALWGCRKHWFKLPMRLRLRIWDTYQPGQEARLDPSREYLSVANEVQRWIKDNYDGEKRRDVGASK